VSAVTDVFRRFWRYTRGDRHRLALGGLGALAVSGCELGTAGLFGVITDSVLARHRLAAFWELAGWWAGLVAVAAVAMFLSQYVSTLASERFALRLRDDMFARAQRLPPDFFDRRHLGDLMVRLTEDVAVVEGVVSSGLLGVATSAVSAALFAAAAFVISWPLALVAAAVAPVFWLASRGFSGRLQRAAERERVVTGKLSSAIEESLSNQALIQAFDRQADESRRLHAAGDSWLRASMAETRLSAAYGSLVYVIETLCVLIVFGFGAWELTRAAITLGGLLAFATLLAYLYAPVQGLAGYRLSVSEASESVARIAEILDARSGVADGTAVGVRARGSGFIAFDDVCFAYPEPGVPVLRHLSFRAEPGQVVAITGPSGSGKSTVAKLLLRFYDPGEGSVLLDGIDIRGLPLSALRHSITLLQQENLLFSGTVADNIGYGRQDATAAEIAAAAEAAGADDFIRALPDGYNTPVGQRGRLLSGGQRQRIAIARALLRDAPVLVLDEPTAGLSPADARLVMKLLTPITAGRTIIVITHDPAVAALAGQIVTLDVPTPGAVPGPAVTEATTAASL
jgi:ATP-binding cassette, subfamily B, bacterial